MSADALRADFGRLEIVHTDEMPWSPSPSPTVWRKRLERSGPVEAGRVTSVVRYDPGSRFHRHPHPDGEEILVLEGVFEDERGAHPAGSLLLAAEGFEHGPGSTEGCLLFVKLRQYAGDRPTRAIASGDLPWRPHPTHAGVAIKALYAEPGRPEEIRLVRFDAGIELPPIPMPGGEEIFVIEGDFTDEHGAYRKGSWVRYPTGAQHRPRTEGGCVLYVKKGHLLGL